MPPERESPEIHVFQQAALSCPIPAAVDLIGEKWAFLILRGALNGLKHFEEFQAGLGIARNILSDRLGKMVAGDIMARSADPTDRRKVVYSLTRKGEGLLPVFVSMRQWGEEWGHGVPKVLLADRRDGRPIKKLCLLSHDGRPLGVDDLTWIDSSGEKAPLSSAA
ncbi:MAG: helix-turn-helix domain-containing protein [Sphingomicrobium sp.]